ncbi:MULTISPECIES: hypothetical protein [unclassified Mesorhizobium]
MAIEKELLNQQLAGRDPNEVFANEVFAKGGLLETRRRRCRSGY